MKINCICRNRLKEDGGQRNVELLTIDEGWSEITDYAAIFTPAHAKYKTEKFQLTTNDNTKYFTKEIE